MAYSDEKKWRLLLLFWFFHVFYLWLATLLLRTSWWGSWPATEIWQYFHNIIYVSGPIFAKLANDFNRSCLSPTFVKKKVFPVEHLEQKGLDFLSFTLHSSSFWNSLVYFSGWQKVQRLTKVTVRPKIHS